MKNLKQSISQLYIPGIVAAVGLIVIFAALSFYFTNGYINIGEDKSRAFYVAAGIAVPVWIVVKAVWLVFAGEKAKSHTAHYNTEEMRENKMGMLGITGWRAPEIFLCMYVLAAVISTLTSEYKRSAIFGQPGWNLGLIVQLLMVGMYLMARDVFTVRESRKSTGTVLTDFSDSPMIVVMLGISAVVIFLGTINRYSIYPIHMLGEAEDFISTIGNINWFCGYWCIWYGIGCGIFLTAKGLLIRVLSGVYVLLCATAGVSCGAMSCYLAAMGISFAALLWALSDSERLERLCIMEIIQVSALPIIRIIGWARPYRMWYDSELLRQVTYGNGWIAPFVGGVVVFGLLRELFAWKRGDYSRFRIAVVGIPAGIGAAVIVMIVLNTVIDGGIWPVRGMSAFTWSIRWGNSRGGIWMATLEMIRSMLPARIFFGVGPDCFCDYAFSRPDFAALLYRYIGNQLLTCAHNEILTMLVNEGIFGTAAFIGLLVSHIMIGIKSQRGRFSLTYSNSSDNSKTPENKSERTVPADSPILLGAVLALSAYIAIGTVGFAQILSTPFVFVVIGAIAGLTEKTNFLSGSLTPHRFKK